MGYSLPTAIAGTTLITPSMWEADHYDNWSWLASMTLGGKALSGQQLPLALGSQIWLAGYQGTADFSNVNFDTSGLATRYRAVQVRAKNLKSDDGTSYTDWAHLSINNDKTNTYYQSMYRALRTTPLHGAYNATEPGWVIAACASNTNSGTQCYGGFEALIHLPRQGGTADYPVVTWNSMVVNTQTGQIFRSTGNGRYTAGTTVDRIDLDLVTGTNFLAGGSGEPTTRIDLYGILGVEEGG